ALGHRRIGHITRPQDCTPVRDRMAGYKQALIDAGLPVKPQYVRGGADEGASYRAARELLRMEERPSAIFAVSDSTAISSFRAIKDSGLRVPEDIALVGFGNGERSVDLEVPLTAVDQPKSEMGEKATEVLVQRIEHPEMTEVQRIQMRPRLVIRESCGASRMGVIAGASG
ncbi:unnamed protein product, partial [marine sediment metagenome]